MKIIPKKDYKKYFRTFCKNCNNEIDEIKAEDITYIEDLDYVYIFNKKSHYKISLITCPNCGKIIKVNPFSSYLKLEEEDEN